jgi:hypothetical protein
MLFAFVASAQRKIQARVSRLFSGRNEDNREDPEAKKGGDQAGVRVIYARQGEIVVMRLTSWVIRVISTGALLMLAAPGCKRDEANDTSAPKPGASVQVPDTWSTFSAHTPGGVTVSLAVPSDWNAVAFVGPIMSLRAPTPVGNFYTNVNVIAEPFDGGIDEYVSATLRALQQSGRRAAGQEIQLDGRPAHELVSDWSKPDRHSVQAFQVTGQEGIVVTCSIPSGMLDELHGLCRKIFGTVSLKTATTGR